MSELKSIYSCILDALDDNGEQGRFDPFFSLQAIFGGKEQQENSERTATRRCGE